jgi:hypothetical protein
LGDANPYLHAQLIVKGEKPMAKVPTQIVIAAYHDEEAAD